MAKPKRKSSRSVPEIWDELKSRHQIMLTPTAKALLNRQAKDKGLSASEYIERSVRSEAFRLYAVDDLRLLAAALNELVTLHKNELTGTGLWVRKRKPDSERVAFLTERIEQLERLLNQLSPIDGEGL